MLPIEFITSSDGLHPINQNELDLVFWAPKEYVEDYRGDTNLRRKN